MEAAARALFRIPEPFEDRGKGAIIIASATGKVSVIPAPRYSGSQEVKPVARDVIVGEPLPHGSTIMTGVNSEADLLLNHRITCQGGSQFQTRFECILAEGFSGIGKKGDRLEGGDQSQSGSLQIGNG